MTPSLFDSTIHSLSLPLFSSPSQLIHEDSGYAALSKSHTHLSSYYLQHQYTIHAPYAGGYAHAVNCQFHTIFRTIECE